MKQPIKMQLILAGALAVTALNAMTPGRGGEAFGQAPPPEARHTQAQLTGSWLTAYQVGGFRASVPVLLTFGGDKTVIESDSPAPNPLFPNPIILSNGHGAWVPSHSARDYTFFYRKLIFEQDGLTPFGTTTTLGKLTLSADGQTFQASVEITFLDTGNKVLNRTNGTVTGSRIVVPEESIGGPGTDSSPMP